MLCARAADSGDILISKCSEKNDAYVATETYCVYTKEKPREGIQLGKSPDKNGVTTRYFQRQSDGFPWGSCLPSYRGSSQAEYGVRPRSDSVTAVYIQKRLNDLEFCIGLTPMNVDMSRDTQNIHALCKTAAWERGLRGLLYEAHSGFNGVFLGSSEFSPKYCRSA